jgi:hypothetical protein
VKLRAFEPLWQKKAFRSGLRLQNCEVDEKYHAKFSLFAACSSFIFIFAIESTLYRADQRGFFLKTGTSLNMGMKRPTTFFQPLIVAFLLFVAFDLSAQKTADSLLNALKQAEGEAKFNTLN